VLLFFNLSHASLGPVLAARHAGVPTLGYVADPWPENHWVARWRADARARAKRSGCACSKETWSAFRGLVGLGPLQACSAWMRAALIEDGILPESVDVLHLGVSPALAARAAATLRRSAARGEPLRVVCTSMLWEGKGQHVLLKAAARSRAAGVALELDLAGAGEPSYGAYLRELGRRARARGRRALPRVCSTRRASRRCFARAHVFALPSVWPEPFGLSTAEAMAHGVAALGSDSGATPELDRGRRHRPARGVRRPGGVVPRAVRLAGDEGERRRLAAGGRAHAARAFDHGRFLDGLERGLAGSRRRPGREDPRRLQRLSAERRWGTGVLHGELVRGLAARGHELAVLYPERQGKLPRYTVQELHRTGSRCSCCTNAGDPHKGFEDSYTNAGVEAAFGGVLERWRPELVALHLSPVGPLRAPPGGGAGARRAERDHAHGLRARVPPGADVRPPPRELRGAPSAGGVRPLRAHAVALRWGAARHPGEARGDRRGRRPGRARPRRRRSRLARREVVAREALFAARRLIAPTRIMAQRFIAFGAPAERIVPLVYSFDEAPWRAARPPALRPRPRLRLPRPVRAQKGLDVLLEAARLMERRLPESVEPWELLLYGGPVGGRHRFYGPAMLARLQGPRVRVEQPFTPGGAPEVFAQISTVVVPSLWDEKRSADRAPGARSGVPVVASDVPGSPRSWGPSTAGCCAPGDARALADALRTELLSGRRRTASPGLPLSLEEHLARIEEIHGEARSER
jgi:glycosyltransferase involved in cell wall biosynthesis